MKMIKSWEASIIVYPQKRPNKKSMRILRLNGPNEQTVRRLILDAVHEEDQFVHEFLSIERIEK